MMPDNFDLRESLRKKIYLANICHISVVLALVSYSILSSYVRPHSVVSMN